jgi:Zn-finger protein
MPEITVDVEVQIWCSCGEGLCHQSEVKEKTWSRQSNGIIVKPCKRCLERARNEGYRERLDEEELNALA